MVGRDTYGVYPLRGKLINVREENKKKILKNKEISDIIKILNLDLSKEYANTSSLRYGSIMIMAD